MPDTLVGRQELLPSQEDPLNTAATEKPLRLARPELLLHSGRAESPAVISIMHASTLFEGGAFAGDALTPRVNLFAHRCHAGGIDTLYGLGTWAHTAAADLMAEYNRVTFWGGSPDRSWVAGSTFSIDQYVPIPEIGGMEDLGRLNALFHRHGITYMPCWVTNTVGLLGTIMRKHPEFMIVADRPGSEFDDLRQLEAAAANSARWSGELTRPAGASSPGRHELKVFPLGGDQIFAHTYVPSNAGEPNFTAYTYRTPYGFRPYTWAFKWRERDCDGKKISLQHWCMKLGSDCPYGTPIGSPWVGDDVVALDTRSAQVQEWQAKQLIEIYKAVDVTRADLAHIYGIDAWRRTVDRLREQYQEGKKIVAEAYLGIDGQLMELGMLPYAECVHKWLAKERNFGAFMEHVHHNGRGYYEQGKAVGFTSNQDEEPVSNHLVSGALAAVMCASPLRTVMEAQGQAHGVDYRFSSHLQLPWPAFRTLQHESLKRDQGHARFWTKLNRLMGAEVFRSPHSQWWKASIGELTDDNAVFHIVRTLATADGHCDRVLAVVDKIRRGEPIRVDLARTFRVPVDELSNYGMVQLLTGEVREATPSFEMRGGPYTSHIWALVPKQELDRAASDRRAFLREIRARRAP